jgi:hypothetical protein
MMEDIGILKVWEIRWVFADKVFLVGMLQPRATRVTSR